MTVSPSMPALERYAVGDGEGNVSVYRVADGREIVRLPRGRGPSRRLEFSPDGRYLIAAYAVRGAVGPTSSGTSVAAGRPGR